MGRKYFRIITTFIYANNTPGSILRKTVNSRSAVDLILDATRKWLDEKGHTPVETTVTEITKAEYDAAPY